MVLEFSFDEIFEPTEDGKIKISKEAPELLKEAIKEAKKSLTEDNDWTVRAVGEPRRSIEFGTKNLDVIETVDETLFTAETKEGEKILAVGVSHEGPLSKEQITDVFKRFGEEAKLTPEERWRSSEAGKAIDSLRQSKLFVTENTRRVQENIGKLMASLDNAVGNEEKIITQCEELELNLHNLLSSVYTFNQNIDSTLQEFDVIIEMKHHNQRYKDKVSTAIGLRHCVQHQITLRVHWIMRYSDEIGGMEYTIGVPLRFVNKNDIYTTTPSDASGEKYEPTEYYYGDVDSYLICLESLTEEIEEATEDVYETIIRELEEKSLIEIEQTMNFLRLKYANIVE